ncbi:O-antigen ligase family protein [Pseudonocardia kujensis]|uniref:O-antigen ligase family protein n=1 Tax=Pseudonocardia kujensis TaxID=1128675 RepID=UPI001E54AF3D|nr:O-antigen ligase family protein [Pseudonocardia kujensis]MCE0763115.1 O-antigen ligase family protein [Pseudonocardia kujensis]
MARLDPAVRRLRRLDGTGPTGERDQYWRTLAALVVATVATAAGLFVAPVSGPTGLLVMAVGGVVALLVLRSPVLALGVLVVASFLRLALQVPGLPAEPMVLVLCLLIVSAFLYGLTGRARFRFTGIEAAMTAYLLWNVASMLMPHELPPIQPGTGQDIVVYRFILTGTVLPFAAFVVARAVLGGEDRVRRFLIFLVVPAVYSALVSVLQFTGPPQLVFPSYIVTDPSYPERAVGVVNQPVVNGMIMVVGFVTAMMLAHHRSLSRNLRVVMLLSAVACIPGIYLTKTRAVWLVFGLSLVVCAVLSRPARRGFVTVLVAALLAIAVNWSSFTSSDRTEGGIASTNEVDDRLNSIATAVWAIDEKPLLGWGIARFAQVNAVYHQTWGPDVKFERGYGIASHENELGIAAELGLFGLALWLGVALPLTAALLRALRRLPTGMLSGRPLGLIALTALGVWVVTGFTADLRYFDFANLITFTLIGATVGASDRLRTRPRHPAAMAPEGLAVSR